MGFFDSVDSFLDNGGQTVLNGANLGVHAAHAIPLYGTAVAEIGGGVLNGAQALYHGAHGVHDLMEGNYHEAAIQGAETLWHGLSAIPGLGDVGVGMEAMAIPFDVGGNIANLAGTAQGKPAGKPGEGILNDHGRIPSLPGMLGGLVGSMFGLKDKGHGGGEPHEPAAHH